MAIRTLGARGLGGLFALSGFDVSRRLVLIGVLALAGVLNTSSAFAAVACLGYTNSWDAMLAAIGGNTKNIQACAECGYSGADTSAGWCRSNVLKAIVYIPQVTCPSPKVVDPATGACIDPPPPPLDCPDGTSDVNGVCSCPVGQKYHCFDVQGVTCACMADDHCSTRSDYDLTACSWVPPGSALCSNGCIMSVSSTRMQMYSDDTGSSCGTAVDYRISFTASGAQCNQPYPDGPPQPGDPDPTLPTDPTPTVPPPPTDPDPDPDAPPPLWPDPPDYPDDPSITPGTGGDIAITINSNVPPWLTTAPIWWTRLPDDIATALQPGVDQITGSIDGLKDALTGDPDGTCVGDPGACDGAPPSGGGDGREPFTYDGDEADLGLAWDELVGSVGQTGWLQTPDFSCMSNGSATCPPLRATIMGRAVETSVHCTIAASAGPYLQAALWLMGGLAATRAVLTA